MQDLNNLLTRLRLPLESEIYHVIKHKFSIVLIIFSDPESASKYPKPISRSFCFIWFSVASSGRACLCMGRFPLMPLVSHRDEHADNRLVGMKGLAARGANLDPFYCRNRIGLDNPRIHNSETLRSRGEVQLLTRQTQDRAGWQTLSAPSNTPESIWAREKWQGFACPLASRRGGTLVRKRRF